MRVEVLGQYGIQLWVVISNMIWGKLWMAKKKSRLSVLNSSRISFFAGSWPRSMCLLDHVSGSSSKSLPAAFDEKDETVGRIDDRSDMRHRLAYGGYSTGAGPKSCHASHRQGPSQPPRPGLPMAPLSPLRFLYRVTMKTVAKRQARRRALLRWPHMRSPTDAAPLPVDPSDGPNRWQGPVPSRTSLARHAYPGLVATASRFNRRVKTLTYLLLGWLILTCMLSWNVAAGHAIVARLDAANVAVADPKKVGTDTAELTSRLESARQNLQNWQDTWDWAQGTHWICGSLVRKA